MCAILHVGKILLFTLLLFHAGSAFAQSRTVTHWDTDGGDSPFVEGCVLLILGDKCAGPRGASIADYCKDENNLTERIAIGCSNTYSSRDYNCYDECRRQGHHTGECKKVEVKKCNTNAYKPEVGRCECRMLPDGPVSDVVSDDF